MRNSVAILSKVFTGEHSLAEEEPLQSVTVASPGTGSPSQAQSSEEREEEGNKTAKPGRMEYMYMSREKSRRSTVEALLGAAG